MEASPTRLERAGIQPAVESRPIALPWYLYAVLFASTSVVVGVIWDISWHTTIGRDTFWTPAHLAIYAGGAAAGIGCGFLVLISTVLLCANDWPAVAKGFTQWLRR